MGGIGAGATAEELLALAREQLGEREVPAGSNRVKYNTAYYGRAVSGASYPWCCAFIWWLFRELGASALYFGGRKTASCTTLCTYHRQVGQAVQEYQPGDIIFFDFSGKGKRTEHVGVCERVEPGHITTIDGNTGTENEANGGAVMRRRRALRYVSGAYRPGYRKETMTKEELREQMEELLRERELLTEKTLSSWAAGSWDRAVAQGVFDGTRPGGVLTREQAAVVLDRLGLLKEEERV